MAKIDKTRAIMELKALVKKKKLIILVGAGVSIDSGLPTWEQLLQRFMAMCSSLPLRPQQKKELDSLLDAARPHLNRDPVRVATVLKDRLKRLWKGNDVAFGKYKNWLVTEFGSAKPNPKHHLVVKIDFPFILTTNYDELLEEAAAINGFYDLSGASYTFKKGPELAGAIARRTPSIVHIHGKVDTLESGEIVFTQDDYREMIKSRYEGFSFALRMLFFDYSVLYIGYGASDPHLEDIAQDLTAYFPTDTEPVPFNTSYLVLKEEKIDEVMVEYKTKLRTHLVPINTYEEVDEILEELLAVAPRANPPTNSDLGSGAQQELPGV